MARCLEQEDIARLKSDLEKSAKTSSTIRLQLKKHDALVNLIREVEPDYRQRLQTRYEQLEKEEAEIVEREIRNTDSYGANKIDMEPVPGAWNNSDVTRALLEMSPSIGQHLTQPLSIPIPSRATGRPAPRSYQIPTLSDHSNSSLSGISHEDAPPSSVSPVRDTKRGYHHILSDTVSSSVGEPEEEVQTRPRKCARLTGNNVNRSIEDSESVSDDDTDEEIPANPRNTQNDASKATKRSDDSNVLMSSGDPREVRNEEPGELRSTDNGIMTLREQREQREQRQASMASSKTLDHEPSSSARPGLRGNTRPSGGYNDASYYRSQGLLRGPRKST